MIATSLLQRHSEQSSDIYANYLSKIHHLERKDRYPQKGGININKVFGKNFLIRCWYCGIVDNRQKSLPISA